MSTLSEALCWRGSTPELCLFMIVPDAEPPLLSMEGAGVVPDEVRHYHLDDDAGRLVGRQVFEFDAYLSAVPDDLLGYIERCLDDARGAGADVAWFGFEGSFSFDHLLTDDIAPQVYGVVDSSGGTAAIGYDDRTSEAWRARLRVARSEVRFASPSSG